MIESNRNITKEINTPAAKRNNNSTTKKNLPAGKNNTQSSDTHCKKLKCSDNNNPTASMTQTTSTSKMQTRKRQSENNNGTHDQHKKSKLQNNDTNSTEIKCTTKRKLATQRMKSDSKIPRNDDMEKLIKPEHKLKRVQIKIPNILAFLHHQQNKKTLTKAKQDNILCKQYGYNFKIPLIHITHIATKNTKKNAAATTISKLVKYKYGRNLHESIKIFNDLTLHGPIYICSICQQTNFIDKVAEIAKLRTNKNVNLLNECRTNYKSINNKEYICYTCKKYIYKGKIPKLSIKNGCGFPNKPKELDLFNLEE